MEELSKHIAQIIQAIRAYTNRPYIGNLLLKGEIEIKDGLLSPMLSNLKEGDIIEIYGSIYSNGVYLVKNGNELYADLRDEKFKGCIALIQTPLNLTSLLALSNYSSTIMSDPAIRREGVGDVSYTYHTGSDLVQGYPKTIMSSLSSERRLPSNYNKELYHAGVQTA